MIGNYLCLTNGMLRRIILQGRRELQIVRFVISIVALSTPRIIESERVANVQRSIDVGAKNQFSINHRVRWVFLLVAL